MLSVLIECADYGRRANYRVDLGPVGEFWIAEDDLEP